MAAQQESKTKMTILTAWAKKETIRSRHPHPKLNHLSRCKRGPKVYSMSQLWPRTRVVEASRSFGKPVVMVGISPQVLRTSMNQDSSMSNNRSWVEQTTKFTPKAVPCCTLWTRRTWFTTQANSWTSIKRRWKTSRRRKAAPQNGTCSCPAPTTWTWQTLSLTTQAALFPCERSLYLWRLSAPEKTPHKS